VFQPTLLLFAAGEERVITMALMGKIRGMYFRDQKSISEIARLTSLSRNTIKRWLRAAPGTQPKYSQKEYVEEGGLMAFGVNLSDLFGRAADYLDRVLKGASPADTAVEQPTKFELVINLKTAKTLGLTIPHSLLSRADEVIQ
jgi:transcriptional regulator with XRE-family HTH domain